MNESGIFSITLEFISYQPFPFAMTLDVRHFRLLTALAQGQTLSAIADAFSCTQSALSHQLREAERRLGVELVVRTGKGLELNEAGRLLVAAAQSALPELGRAEEQAVQLAKLATRTLKVSTECYTCYHWMPRFLEEIRKQAPSSLRLEIAIEATQHPLAALAEHRIDLAIMSTLIKDPAFAQVFLFDDEHVVAMSPQHRLAGRKIVKAEHLKGEVYVSLNVDSAADFGLQQIFLANGVQPDGVLRVGLTEAVIGLVASGSGIALLPAWVCSHAIASGKIVTRRLGPKRIFRRWHAIYRKTQEPFSGFDQVVALLSRTLSADRTH